MKNLLFIFGLGLLLGSCSTLNKSRMLRTPRNYEFKEFTDSLKKTPYTIAIDDEIEIRLYSNDGYNLIQLSGNGSEALGNRGTNILFKVRTDSTIKVPVIGKVNVFGLTLSELENKFESILINHFNDPFVIARIQNRRVFLFKGGDQASIVNLQNENTTLFEVLANAGGIPKEGNASRIKVIRGDLANPDIYLIDLSTIDGIKHANLNMKAGDIIYIDPFFNYATRISSDISSIMGLLSSILLVYSITQTN